MTPMIDDKTLDRQLREAVPYINDDGFTARVIARLPAPRSEPRWLRAMIVHLTNTLPVDRHSALREELEALDSTIEKLYVLPKDLKLARIPDLQGLGGSSHSEELS